MRFKAVFATITAILASYGVSSASYGEQLAPVYIDREAGYVYFLVQNNWNKPINNLFGWVYGSDPKGREAARLVNNPHQQGMKVSIESHSPGNAGLYRFKIPAEYSAYPEYRLIIQNDSLYHSWVARWYK
ncbi:MAG: hypothetical protein HZB29_05095 [Nitrospinae bacterium]|nr:hypothetical protein [Nitrospinota bacterium]